MGKFLSYCMKKNAPLWMRTHAGGRYCLTAIALGAGVRQDAHFFTEAGQSNPASARRQVGYSLSAARADGLTAGRISLRSTGRTSWERARRPW